jgi:hypothetical protein
LEVIYIKIVLNVGLKMAAVIDMWSLFGGAFYSAVFVSAGFTVSTL